MSTTPASFATFNEPTSMRDCREYVKLDQENDSMFNYVMMRPTTPMCYADNVILQGQSQSYTRQPPPNLFDIEEEFRDAPLRDRLLNNIVDTVHKPPPPEIAAPQIDLFSTDCAFADFNLRVSTKTKKTDLPSWSIQMDQTSRDPNLQRDYMTVGRNTRQEIKDEWASHQFAGRR